MPIGWNLSVDDNSSWNTRVRATVLVPSAALDASFFRSLLAVEKDTSLSLPFGITGEIVVSKDFLGLGNHT
jgi:hypothetical protein